MDLFNEKNSHGGQSSNENIYTKTVQQLFEEQVLKYPSNIALVFEDRKLTYKELNEKSNQLAHYLKTLGVGPEIIVGLCLERSLEIVIAILAVLKAGGAYLPLDLSHPKERILSHYPSLIAT
jgi:non-ribosomal peptide synthetase component F